MISDELVLVLLRHVGKTVVLALELTIEFGKSFAGDGFDLSSLGSSAPWGKGVTSIFCLKYNLKILFTG